MCKLHNILKFIFGIKLCMFRIVPLSIIRRFSLYTQQWYMSYRFAESTVKNSWWWTEELSETCRGLFQKWNWDISASSRFYCKNLSRRTVTWMSNSIQTHMQGLFYKNPYTILRCGVPVVFGYIQVNIDRQANIQHTFLQSSVTCSWDT